MQPENFANTTRRNVILTGVLAGSPALMQNVSAQSQQAGKCAVQSGLVKHVGFVTRKPSFSTEEFRAYWFNKHAPLLMRMPGVLRYAINVVDRALFPAFEYEGFSEVWFSSEEARVAAFASPEGVIVAADVPNFVDRRLAIVTTERQFM